MSALAAGAATNDPAATTQPITRPITGPSATFLIGHDLSPPVDNFTIATTARSVMGLDFEDR
jgi:hypothetical protein